MILDRDTIQTKKNYFHFTDFSKDLFDIEDIAHALSNICRFNGHCEPRYSVAQHLCFVYDLMKKETNDRLAFHGLMHDAHEAYYSDMPRPVKGLLKDRYNFDFNELTDELDLLIFAKYGVEIEKGDNEIIKSYDNIALFTEKAFLFKIHFEWGWSTRQLTEEEFKPYLDETKDWAQEFLIRFRKERP